jgi:hypothetical protein
MPEQLFPENEIWKDIVGFEGCYLISNSGKIKSFERKREMRNGAIRTYPGIILKPFYSRKYHIVELSNQGNKKMFHIHRLVALHFVDNPESLPEVNHEDCNTLNNWYWNLKWCTRQYNIQHAVDNGLIIGRKGSENGTAILKEEDIPIIRARRAAGETYISIAGDFGVDFTNIYHIIKGNTWKHVK